MKSCFLVTLLFLLLFAVGQAPAQEKRGFRLIGVPPREHGYKYFNSQVIDSQDKFDAFVGEVEAQRNWNNRAGFLKALADAKLDFSAESLVLVRQTEGSGSIRLGFAPPELKGEKSVCVIQREVPQVMTADMAFYCFAVAVGKGKTKEAEVWMSTKGAPKANQPQEVLSLTAK